MMGPAKKSKKYTDTEKALVAYHESGHAVIGIRLKYAAVVQKITIVPRGDAGGYHCIRQKCERVCDSVVRVHGVRGYLQNNRDLPCRKRRRGKSAV